MSQKYLQNPDSRSIGTSESRVNLGLTILPPPLQEKAGVQTQGQEVKERMEVRHANENRAIKGKSSLLTERTYRQWKESSPEKLTTHLTKYHKFWHLKSPQWKSRIILRTPTWRASSWKVQWMDTEASTGFLRIHSETGMDSQGLQAFEESLQY